MIVDTTCTITHTTVADASAWYSVPFQYEIVLSVPQITVTLSDDELTYMEDYIVGASGVQLTTAPAADMKLVISRSTPLEQNVDFQTGMVDPDEIEHSFDLAVMRDQELSSRIDVVEELPEDHEERITAIEEVIPAEANVDNKLTDKDYVDTLVSNHTNRTDNPHSVTAAQVGLGNCDNTSDLDKPISTATQGALDGKVDENAAITGATKCKITYDSKGLVTAGEDIDTSDLTDVDISSVQDGEFLRYDGVAGKWKNTASTAVVGFDSITGDPYDNTNLSTALNAKAPATAVDTLLAALYPVGSIYVGTQSTCPLATLMAGTTWEAVQGRYLLASGTLTGTSETYVATNTVASGLPNVTGEINTHVRTPMGGSASGAFALGSTSSVYSGDYAEPNASRYIYMNSSYSNSTYGQSAAVRAPAYVVNVWRRTA